MSEITRTMSQWIQADLEMRKLRAKVRQSMALCNQPKRPPVVLASLRPAAAAKATAVTPPKPDLRPPVELSDEPTHDELAAFMGISPKQLEEAIGMKLERLAQFMDKDRRELAQLLAETLRIDPASKWAAKSTKLRVAVAKLRLYGFDRFAQSVRAKAKRADALKTYHARAKLG